MPRSVNAVASRARKKKILKRTRGYYGAKKNVFTIAKNTYEKGLKYAYRDRKTKKRNLTGTTLVHETQVHRIKAMLVK